MNIYQTVRFLKSDQVYSISSATSLTLSATHAAGHVDLATPLTKISSMMTLDDDSQLSKRIEKRQSRTTDIV